MNTIRNLQLTLLALAGNTLLATPAKKKNATEEEKVFFARGKKHMTKLVELCKKKEFDGLAYDGTMVDQTMNKTFEALEAPRTSARHKNAFNNYQSYLCGMRSAIKTYRPQRRNPQDACMRYNRKTIDFALKAPNWDTVVENNRNETVRFMKRMQEVRWEVLAELA